MTLVLSPSVTVTVVESPASSSPGQEELLVTSSLCSPTGRSRGWTKLLVRAVWTVTS